MAYSTTKRAINRLAVSVAGLMSGSEERNMDHRSDEHRILVIGKSGNAKSSVCNTLTGTQAFKIGRGLAATTRTLQHHDVNKYGYHIRVVDTPDVTNSDMTTQEMEQEVGRWRRATAPYPTAVLLAVRCDVRYTAEEHAIYRQIQRLWGDNSLTERLVVAFTFADRQDVPIEQELPTVCPELKGVLRDASHRYLLFNNKVSIHERDSCLQQLLNMDTSHTQTGRPNYLLRALVAVFVISGLCFAATFTANKSGPSTGFGLLCLAAGVGVVILRIIQKQG